MKALVLHNNNLPREFLVNSSEDNISITSKSVAVDSANPLPFDTFISKRLSNRDDIDLSKHYDIIILPYNTTENYLEYTGLRIAAHLRFAKECMSTPILFLVPM